MQDISRFDRQVQVDCWGEETQSCIEKKHILVVGAGGLGSHLVDGFARLGVGRITVVDDDVVNESNLHRVAVFDDEDIGLSKAVVLAKKVNKIKAPSEVRGIESRIDESNIDELLEGVDLVVDALDSMDTRLIINDACVNQNVAFVYGGIQGTGGMILGVIPKKTACLRCLHLTSENNESGIPVIGNVPGLIAAYQISEAIGLLCGKTPRGLIMVDVWKPFCECIEVKRRSDCPVCGGD